MIQFKKVWTSWAELFMCRGWLWIRGVTQSKVSLCRGFLWIRGVTQSKVSLCRGCLWIRGVTQSKVSLCRGCLWIRGVTLSKVSLCRWCLWIRGVTQSKVSLCRGCHKVRVVIKSEVSLGQGGSLWVRMNIYESDMSMSQDWFDDVTVYISTRPSPPGVLTDIMLLFCNLLPRPPPPRCHVRCMMSTPLYCSPNPSINRLLA